MSQELAQQDASSPIAIIEAGREQLESVGTVEEAMAFRDGWEALCRYAGKRGQAMEVQNAAAENRIRIDRKIGEMLRDHPGFRVGRPKNCSGEARVTLKSMGITATMASQCQLIAKLPKGRFDAYLTETKTAGKEITTRAVEKLAKEYLQKQQEQDDKAAVEAAVEAGEQVGTSGHSIQVLPGDLWQLRDHVLYCGDSAGDEFRQLALDSSPVFAFADCPYNANVAPWDQDFEWNHDWLIEEVPIVAVTPGIASLNHFLRTTDMPYVWTMSCRLHGATSRGKVGFSGWIPVVLFSKGSVHVNALDVWTVQLPNKPHPGFEHKGRKPLAMMLDVVRLYATAGLAVVDPFLGAGTTLTACEELGMKCVGAEINPDYCAGIIAEWEALTGGSAKLLTRVDDPDIDGGDDGDV